MSSYNLAVFNLELVVSKLNDFQQRTIDMITLDTNISDDEYDAVMAKYLSDFKVDLLLCQNYHDGDKISKVLHSVNDVSSKYNHCETRDNYLKRDQSSDILKLNWLVCANNLCSDLVLLIHEIFSSAYRFSNTHVFAVYQYECGYNTHAYTSNIERPTSVHIENTATSTYVTQRAHHGQILETLETYDELSISDIIDDDDDSTDSPFGGFVL